ncbi:nucleotidyl transferase AbiEii/AbiGii toxin family protein [Jiangella asiatica]|uniref:Nucleotidyl transferase AbiEii/AbiGii toxin family protein n=1 Tax=Jiangella asiatica TaxID=2530372 RepID=A0A4R5DKW7_9ACTN|nr:nucleotidyl transferase AbiEii/AbiGii toxin family protein [Jiangella asiatica]TDE11485.1 nucleotidyl transferase AbiEii/AbiGii toxin family protein [Jiangella asiatica]
MTTSPGRRPTRATAGGRAYLDLRRHARATGRDTGEVLQLYVLEGFLDRLRTSPLADRLILKGGVLLAAFDTRRPTRDIDVAALDLDRDAQSVLHALGRVAAVHVDDGLAFDHGAATATAIRDDELYGGIRVTMPCSLDRARMRFHVDVNVGDPIWPAPRPIELPRLLGGSIRLLGYPLSMVFAEKLVTAAERGAANTRWRDFADVYLLSRRHDQDGTELVVAIRRVAEHRGTELHRATVDLDGFADLAQSRWRAWRNRLGLDDRLPESFAEVLGEVDAFAAAALDGSAAGRHWSGVARHWT